MRRDLERRLRAIEVAVNVVEVWIDQGDGTLRGPRGEQMTRQAFDHAHPRGSGLVFVIDAQDALA